MRSLATAATENAPEGLGEVPSQGLIFLPDPQEEREQLLLTAVAKLQEHDAGGRGRDSRYAADDYPFHLGDNGAVETQMEMGM